MMALGVGRHMVKALHWLRRRRPSPMILMYHRVARPEVDPWALSVSPAHFAEQLEVLQRRRVCLPLADLVLGLMEHRLPARALAITFDDGYADNLHEAAPALERYQVPATVFLVTGSIGSDREFWWDELERVLLHPGRLPATLALKVGGVERRWSLGEAAEHSPEQFARHRSWCGWDEPPGRRQLIFRQVYDWVRSLQPTEQDTVLDQLRAWVQTPAQARSSHRILTAAEAAELARSPMISIGAHTMTHPALPELTKDAQRREIEQSRADCEDLTGGPIHSFSYPFSATSDLTRELVARSGMLIACAGQGELVQGTADPLMLPRVPVFDWGGQELSRRLALSW
jgi:peptidoglycan/xylan/chitin deacetylase (PgdA/CDA1 family)